MSGKGDGGKVVVEEIEEGHDVVDAIEDGHVSNDEHSSETDEAHDPEYADMKGEEDAVWMEYEDLDKQVDPLSRSVRLFEHTDPSYTILTHERLSNLQ